jgi:hypothetical protein
MAPTKDYMKTRWWYLAFFVVVGVGQWLAQSRQGRGILLIAAFAAVLGVAIAWLTGNGPRIRSVDREMSDVRNETIDDHMVP